MIAGFGGDLISHAYLEEHLPAETGAAGDVDFERRALRWWRGVSRSLGPASSARGVVDVAVAPLLELLRHEPAATVPESYGLRGHLPSANAVLLVLPWAWPTSSAWRDAIRCGLGAGVEWAIITNGRALRIADCTRSWTRAGIEFDFERLLLSPRGVAALWALANAGAMSGAAKRTLRSRVIDSDAHASRVCRSLSDGVLGALPRLALSLEPGKSTHRRRAIAFDHALTIVYRILFLLFAEAHGLVPIWNELYRDAYTIDALTARAVQRSPRGLWAALQAISRLAHSGCKAGDLEVTAFNGRLFSPRHAPLIEQRRIPDTVVRDVLLSLATEAGRHGRRRISYHDLGVEQLGSVYERVLEHEPGAGGDTLTLSRTSSRRKATGSFYTPRALTELLVRRTLTPLVEGRSADQILELRIVDPAMGSGAFLVAACRFLSECCEQAMIRDGQWRGGDTAPGLRATLRRNVAERCLYGVDLNATAVQLARLSLWLTTLAGDRPLTFLDHHLATGNSLIGARLADLAQPMPGRSGKTAPSLPLFDDQVAGDVAGRVLPARLRLALYPSDSLDAVKAKERTFAQLGERGGAIAKWTAAADAWCAARLWTNGPAPSPGMVREWIARAIGSTTTLPERQLRASLAQAREVAAGHGVFHWELAFPEVFFDAAGHPSAAGGFDAVLGNPPWDMLRADTGSSSQRSDARTMTAAQLRFCRSSRSYQHQGTGHPNSYQLFVERALRLTRPGGRVGLILPSGIATDHGSASLRRHLFDRTSIDTWLGFDNRARIFPIHRSMRFVVLSTTIAGCTETLRFRCGITDPGALDRDDRHTAPLSIARARLEAWSPEHLTIPEIPNAASLGIIAAIAERVPALSNQAGWHVRFGRELNATDDRPHFVRLTGTPQSILPVVEGKQLAPFQVDLERSEYGIAITTAARLLDRAATFERNRIAYRDVASATNKLTLIAAMLPSGTISTHTVFCLKPALDEQSQWCLLGLLNSFVANYLVRLQVTTHVTTALMARLPVPRPRPDTPEFDRLVELAKRSSDRGVPHCNDDYAELNSIAARLYAITPDQYAHILETFPLIAEDRRSLCLSTYLRATETRKHGTD
ncbi:MAG: N-6 DNA methylase [Vicinamibacterales bacterium]